MAQKLETFSDLKEAIRRELKVQSSSTTDMEKIEQAINMFYVNEVAPKKDWWWLRKRIDLQTELAIFSGTASVVSNSYTVTLSEAPATSKVGWMFASLNYNEIYRVKEHEAGSTTLTIEVPYMGETDTDTRYILWTDEVTLPVDCRDTFEVYHDFFVEPLQGVGFQDFYATTKINPRFEGYPEIYTQDDYVVPADYEAIDSLPATASKRSLGFLKYIRFASTLGSGDSLLIRAGDRIRVSDASDEYFDGESIVQAITTTSTTNDTIIYTTPVSRLTNFAADTGITIERLDQDTENKRLKRLRIHPSIMRTRTLLHVHYTRTVAPMENDSDTPLMPVEDRIVLYYGALSQLWASIGRNPEEAKRNFDLYSNKLAEMTNRYSDSVDFPRMVVSRSYLALKRNSNA